MKRIISILFLLICLNAEAAKPSAYIQYNAHTGDTKLDLQLNEMNIKARANMNDFVSTLGFQYQTSTSKINHLMLDYNFTPADVYMTLSISRETDRSIHDVAHAYKNNKSKGWGVVAKKMGIKPGSKAFHQLKSGTTFRDAVSSGPVNSKEKGKAKNKGNKGQGKNQRY